MKRFICDVVSKQLPDGITERDWYAMAGLICQLSSESGYRNLMRDGGADAAIGGAYLMADRILHIRTRKNPYKAEPETCVCSANIIGLQTVCRNDNGVGWYCPTCRLPVVDGPELEQSVRVAHIRRPTPKDGE